LFAQRLRVALRLVDFCRLEQALFSGSFFSIEPVGTRLKTLAGTGSVGWVPFASRLRKDHFNTTRWARRQAQFAARAARTDDGVQQLGSTDNGVIRARLDAVRTANTVSFADLRDREWAGLAVLAIDADCGLSK
jgi:hypothetical protein